MAAPLRPPSPPQNSFKEVSSLLSAFGLTQIDQLQATLDRAVQKVFQETLSSFLEIQGKLKEGMSHYSRMGFPQTATVIDRYFPTGINVYLVFSQLKMASYRLRSFPQEILRSYQNPELRNLNEIEYARTQAVSQLIEFLKEKGIDDDEKGSRSRFSNTLTFDVPSPQDRSILTWLYHYGGAFVFQGKAVSFGSLVKTWLSLGLSRRSINIKELLIPNDLIADPQEIGDFYRYHKLSFPEFLNQCSLHVLSANLKLVLPKEIREKLEEAFKNEQIRSDLTFFSGGSSRRKFYELNIRDYKRPSFPFIRSFQLFFFLTRNFGIAEEDQSLLLNILFFMRRNWVEDALPLFLTRKWQEQPEVEQGEIEAFQTAWKGLKSIFITPQEASGVDPALWDLLFFLWKSPKRDLMIGLLDRISKLDNFTMNPSDAVTFCQTNESELNQGWVNVFCEGYEEVIQELGQNGVDTQALFFAPVYRLSAIEVIQFGHAKRNTKQFVEWMTPLGFPLGREYNLLFRRYFFSHDPYIFTLLKHLIENKIEPSADLLQEVLENHLLIKPAEQRVQEAALKLIGSIHDTYELSGRQIFSLYAHFLSNGIEISHAELLIERFSALILPKELIYFLFFYNPEIDSTPLLDLVKQRDAWIQGDAFNRFCISQNWHRDLSSTIEQFSRALANACTNDPEINGKICHLSLEALCFSFFSFLQPLIDFFRVTGFDGLKVRWGNPIWKTHLGQIKFSMNGCEIGVYLNWSIIHQTPTLFFSFVNFQKGEAFSAFIPVGKEIGKLDFNFFSFLTSLAPLVLREEATGEEISDDAEDTPENWSRAFGCEHILKSFSEQLTVDEIAIGWDFFKRVKLAYRAKYQRKGSSECPIPEIPTQDVERLTKLFSESQLELSQTGINLETSLGEIPIFFRAETAEELTGESQDRLDRNEVTPSHEQMAGMYVTLAINEPEIEIPLRYPPEAWDHSKLFKQLCEYHLAILKETLSFTSSNK